MPRLDGTGPQGMGPMTGRGMGYCTGDVTDPTYFVRGRGGIGFGRGRGFGMGFGSPPGPGLGVGRGGMPRGLAAKGITYYPQASYQPPLTNEQKLAALNNDKEEIKAQLGGIEKRIQELRE